jgi:hypothetical protein
VAGLFVFAAVAGLCCVVVPPYIIPGGVKRPYYGQTVVPWFQTAIDNIAFAPTWTLLFVLGLALGLIQRRLWWRLGATTILLLPMLLGIDLIRFPKSHNLWPFECAFYTYIGWPAIAGAFAGFLLKHVWN